MMNKMYTNFPHLTSHLEYSLELANPDDDYYYPSSFSSKAISLKINIPEKLCEKLSCNSAMSDSTCLRSTPAAYYRVGDDANFERHCEPSCFHLLNDPVLDDETGEEQVQMVRLKFTEKYGCVILPPAILWHEFPFYRSTEKYEQRVNDLPIGFDKAPENPYSYSGVNYKYNKTYCDAFYDQWSEEKQTCVVKWYERLLYAVVGEFITKMVKAGIDSIANGPKSYYNLPPSIPEIPPIEDVWLVDNWKKDINESFILPPIDFEFDTTFKSYRENEDLNTPIFQSPYKKKLHFIHKIKRQNTHLSSIIRRKIDEYGMYVLTEKELLNIKSLKQNQRHKILDIKFKKTPTSESEDVNSIVESILEGLSETLLSSAFWLDIGFGQASDFILDQVKNITKKLANEIIPKLTKMLIKTSTKVFSEVFAKSFVSTVSQCVSKILIKTVSKIMIQLTKLMAEIASVVGIVLAIITILDIVLMIWDPLNFNGKFNEDVLESVVSQSDVGLRMSLGVAVPEMSFELFANMCLTSEEILDICIHSFFDNYDYLDSLEVNSEGTRIYKGFEFNLSDIDQNKTINDGIVYSKYATQKELFTYERDHALRMKFYKHSNKLILAFSFVGCTLMLCELYIIALIFFLIALVFVFLSFLNTINLNVGKYTEQLVDFNNLYKLLNV